MTTPAETERSEPRLTLFGLPPLALLLLALTAALSLLWSHYKLLWLDEFLVLDTDSVPTLSAIWTIQRHYPLALDPFFYHALIHAAIRLLGACSAPPRSSCACPRSPDSCSCSSASSASFAASPANPQPSSP